MVYALIVSICLSNGLCFDSVPETYNNIGDCFEEAKYLHSKGIRSTCKLKGA